jgi:LacI family gluconate utilization system Gnt-I transcriptional repressor
MCRGYRAALRGHGLRDDPRLWAEADLNYPGGARAMSALLERAPDIDAVFCSSEILALGALFECQRRGLAVPGRIALAGFDDQEISSQCVPALSTVRVPRHEIGRRAGQLICRRPAGLPIESNTTDVGFELALRDTM